MSRYLLPQAMLLTPASLAAPLLTVLEPGRRQYRDGLPSVLVEWLRDLEHLADEQPVGHPSTPVTWITASQAAMLLGLSIRQTTAMASRMGGRKVGKSRFPAMDFAVRNVAASRSSACCWSMSDKSTCIRGICARSGLRVGGLAVGGLDGP